MMTHIQFIEDCVQVDSLVQLDLQEDLVDVGLLVREEAGYLGQVVVPFEVVAHYH